MDLCQSVLPGSRQITATELSREDRALELARLAQVQIGQPGLLSNFVIRLTVSALASEGVPDAPWTMHGLTIARPPGSMRTPPRAGPWARVSAS